MEQHQDEFAGLSSNDVRRAKWTKAFDALPHKDKLFHMASADDIISKFGTLYGDLHEVQRLLLVDNDPRLTDYIDKHPPERLPNIDSTGKSGPEPVPPMLVTAAEIEKMTSVPLDDAVRWVASRGVAIPGGTWDWDDAMNEVRLNAASKSLDFDVVGSPDPGNPDGAKTPIIPKLYFGATYDHQSFPPGKDGTDLEIYENDGTQRYKVQCRWSALTVDAGDLLRLWPPHVESSADLPRESATVNTQPFPRKKRKSGPRFKHKWPAFEEMARDILRGWGGLTPSRTQTKLYEKTLAQYADRFENAPEPTTSTAKAKVAIIVEEFEASDKSDNSV